MDDKVCRKMLINQKYFANLLRLIICMDLDFPEDSPTALNLERIAEEIDKILYEKTE